MAPYVYSRFLTSKTIFENLIFPIPYSVPINCFHSNCNQNNNNGRPQISGSNGNCPDWWTKSATGCYYFGEKFMTWRNSKTFCENIGGFLAEIQNPQQQIFMENMSRSKLSPRVLNVHEWNI